MQLGFCFQGCKMGAKWSTLYTEIPAAEATGKLELRTQAHAVRIEHDAKGRASAVVYADAKGQLHRQKGRIIAIAGNAIETPRLLLNSSSTLFPHGLANGSGMVGKHYMRHTTGSVFAEFSDPVHFYRGTIMAGLISDECISILTAALSAATKWKPSLLGHRSWRHFSNLCLGQGFHPSYGQLHSPCRHVAGGRRHAS